jgi:hypothetical protein
LNDDQQGYFSPPAAPQASPASAWGTTVPPAAPPQGVWGPGGDSYPAYQTPPPSNKIPKAAWIVGGAVGGFFLLAILAAIAIPVFINVNTFGPATSSAKTYLTGNQTGNYATAYSDLCSTDQGLITEAHYAAVESAVHPLSYSIGSRAKRSTAAGDVVLISYTENQSDGHTFLGVLPVIKESGHWKVCHSVLFPTGG